MKRIIRPLSFVLLLAMLLGCSACGKISGEEILNVIAPTEPPQAEVVEAADEEAEEEELPPEQRSVKEFDGCFSPLWATADGDLAVVEATQLSLLADVGGESPSVITSEVNEDGSFTVTIEIRGGLHFSDGTTVDADDLLFTYYALLDPDYSGPYTLGELPILGLEEYYHGVSAELYEKYGELFDEIYDEGKYDESLQKALQEAKDAVPHNTWDESQAQKAVDEYDTEKADDIRAAIQLCWRQDADELAEFCMNNFSNTVEYHTGYTLEEVQANPGLQVMFAMVEWSFANLTEEGVLVAKKSGRTWDLRNSFPTGDDFYQEMYETYGGDAETYWQIEGIGRGDMIARARDMVIADWAAEDEAWTGAVKHVSGINRVGDRLVTVTLRYYDVTFLDTLCNVYLAPMHWYGDETLFDYAAGSYGFPFGDLSSLHEHDGEPMGAGAYVFGSWEGDVVSLSANSGYWAAAPENPRLELIQDAGL